MKARRASRLALFYQSASWFDAEAVRSERDRRVPRHHRQHKPGCMRPAKMDGDLRLTHRSRMELQFAGLQVAGEMRKPARRDLRPDAMPPLERVSRPDPRDPQPIDLPRLQQFALRA